MMMWGHPGPYTEAKVSRLASNIDRAREKSEEEEADQKASANRAKAA